MRTQWLLYLLAASALGSGLQGQTFEVRVVQVVASDNDTVRFQIRRTGAVPFVLSTASFLLNYDTAALGLPADVDAYGCPWSEANDSDYAALRSVPIIEADSAAGFVGLLVEFSGGHGDDGPIVPTSFTGIGTLSFPIKNRSLVPGFTWRNIGANTQVARLLTPGAPGEENITAAGVFLPPDDVPLPIQLASLTGTALEGGLVRLNWVTLSEVNNYGFDVQRSPNAPVAYRNLPNGFVAGHGTSNEPHAYSFIDSTASPGLWLYRLRQIDLDGSQHFTEGIRVNTLTGVLLEPLPTTWYLEQNYPNPFNPSTRIAYSIPGESPIRLEVFDLLGQRVAVLVDEVKRAGSYTALFDASGLGSGLYFCRLSAGAVMLAKKMVVVR